MPTSNAPTASANWPARKALRRGSIAISATDGLTSVTVGGTTLSLTNLANLGTTPVTVDTGEGTLVLTGFTATSSIGGIRSQWARL